MPVSRTRTKEGKRPPKSKADLKRIENIYHAKLDQYFELPLPELEEMLASKKVKGTYLIALDHAIEQKKTISEYEQIQKLKIKSE